MLARKNLKILRGHPLRVRESGIQLFEVVDQLLQGFAGRLQTVHQPAQGAFVGVFSREDGGCGKHPQRFGKPAQETGPVLPQKIVAQTPVEIGCFLLQGRSGVEFEAAVGGHAAGGGMRLSKIPMVGETAEFQPDHGRLDAEIVMLVYPGRTHRLAGFNELPHDCF